MTRRFLRFRASGLRQTDVAHQLYRLFHEAGLVDVTVEALTQISTDYAAINTPMGCDGCLTGMFSIALSFSSALSPRCWHTRTRDRRILCQERWTRSQQWRGGSMAHTITVTDEQYARLQAAAGRFHKTAEGMFAEWLDSLTAAGSIPISDQEYTRRWAAFWPLVGSIAHGQPLSGDDIDELIGEEAADTHADASS